MRACRSRQALGGPMLLDHARARADERVHACSPTGASTPGSRRTCAHRRRAAASASTQRDDERAHLRQPGRHLARLRDVRIHQRRDRPEAHLRDVPAARGRRSCWPTRRLSNVWVLLALGPVTQLLRHRPLQRLRRRHRRALSRPPCARPRKASPTTSAASRARIAPTVAGTRRAVSRLFGRARTRLGCVHRRIAVLVRDSGDQGKRHQIDDTARRVLRSRGERPRRGGGAPRP